MQSILEAVGPRLTEPSTWAGAIGLLINATGWAFLSPELAATLSTALAGISSVVLVIVRERAK